MTEPHSLAECLAAVRAALLSGDFVALDGLAALTERALVDAASLSPDQMTQLKALAEANQTLLDGARKGIRAARRRAQELRDLGSFSTYGPSGARQQTGPSGTRPLHRS